MSNIPPSGGESRWYAVKVRARNEFRVSKVFQNNLNLTTIVPCHKIWKRKKGVKIAHTRPLLSNYVFIRANLGQMNWKLFFSSGGVFGIVRNVAGPAAIPDDQVKLIERLGVANEPVYEVPLSAFILHQKVEVIDGPLKGAIGHFIEISKKTGRFIVCLDLFKRALVTELEVDLVRPF